jgi:hypothetical protein
MNAFPMGFTEILITVLFWGGMFFVIGRFFWDFWRN